MIIKRVCFDYGHGGIDSGAFYKGRKESDDVLRFGRDVAKFVRMASIIVDETRTGDTTTSLWQRANFEKGKKYDFFISFHRNAYIPEIANGAEVFIYLSGGAKATRMANNIQNALVKAGFRDRGVKKANFYVLRATRCPALLVEMGFLDNSKDNDIFDKKYHYLVMAVSNAIIKAVNPSSLSLFH